MPVGFLQIAGLLITDYWLLITLAEIENEAANSALAPAPHEAHHDSLNDQFLGGD